MFLGFLSIIFHSFGTIFFKKSLSEETTLSQLATYILGFFGSIILFLYFIISKSYTFLNLNILIFSGVLGCLILGSLIDNINQYLYKNEKISVLLLYNYLNKIISIISAFFIFGKLSLISFFIALIVCFIIILANIDYKNFIFTKNIKIFIFNQFLISIKTILLGFVLSSVYGITG